MFFVMIGICAKKTEVVTKVHEGTITKELSFDTEGALAGNRGRLRKMKNLNVRFRTKLSKIKCLQDKGLRVMKVLR